MSPILACLRPLSGLFGLVGSLNVPPVLPVTLLSIVRTEVATVVSVAQSASLLSAAQLLPGPVTMTTFGRCVVPVGKVSLSVTEKVSVADPPFGAIDGIVQLRVEPTRLHERLQSPWYVAWARSGAMLSDTGTSVATPLPLFVTVIL